MNAAAESQVILVGTANVEPIRLWEAFRVSVSGIEQTGDRLSCRNLPPAKFGVDQGEANGSCNGGIVAEALLHRGRDQGGLGHQQFPLVAMLQECHESVPDEITGRVMAGVEEKDHP